MADGRISACGNRGVRRMKLRHVVAASAASRLMAGSTLFAILVIVRFVLVQGRTQGGARPVGWRADG
jgi:hypothetical protein